MDKLKSIFKRKKEGAGTAGTKTEAPSTNGGAPAAMPTPSKTDTAAAPSTSEPTAPPAGETRHQSILESADSPGAAPVDTSKPAGTPADPAPASTPA